MDPDTVSNTMDNQYCTQTRTNMRARKRKIDLPPKLRIHPEISSKRSKILHSNTMVQTMGNTHLDLRDYIFLHATIHCGPNQHDNVMRNPLVTTILTQYHVSKGLKVFGDPGVASVLKELKQLHNRMVMYPKLRIHLTINSKRSKVLHTNTMVQTMGNTHLYLRDYARIHTNIHCRSSQHNNVMCNPLITAILTQYHVSKGLKVFGDPRVAAFLKELKQLHNRMVMDP